MSVVLTVPPLNDTELAFRSACSVCPELRDRTWIRSAEIPEYSAKTGIDLDRLTPVPLSENLSEDQFFEPGTNIAIFRHLRYLPAVLHSHRFFELSYVLSGTCRNQIGTELLSMQAGDICIIAPGTEHALSAFSEDAVIYNVLIRSSTFESAFFGTLSERDVLSAFFSHALYNPASTSHILFRTALDEQLSAVFLQLYQEQESNLKYRRRLMDNILTGFFILLLRSHEQHIILPDTANPGQDDDNLFYLLNYIQANYTHVTVRELADFFHYSERQISRLIKEHTGMNFPDLIRRLKLRRSAELLINPDLSVNTVMESVGYADLSSFYKAFKSFYGMTPAQYRQAHQASDIVPS
ncbi:MAG: helix-turn-helix domain-containing protein [Lachnospiraceae bacterium]|nr:helix-turn-helix domain-containing protein [Lachnospiraceae bacterium]